jgi:16S rRNA (guanine966-N2)-methyltransferase
MRVIAGSAGGVRLAVPKRGVRPTMDRVKAAIFSSLGDSVAGARVLDLFAGSGALGIEALSRRAAFAVFVEEDRQSAEIIERNLAKTKLKGRVRQQDVFDFLQGASGVEAAVSAPPQHQMNERFDIIFADPPYERTKCGESYTAKLLTNEALPRLLNFGGVFVLEKRPKEILTERKLWRIIRQKTYGATEVLFLSAICSRGEGSPRQKAKPQREAASERGQRASFNPQLVRRSLGEGGSAIR